MKRVNPKIYSKNYYLNCNLGFEEFKKFKAKKVHPRIKDFVDLLEIKDGMNILDIGCGRGDLAIECARRGAKVIGIDYSKDGIEIAKESLRKQKKLIKQNVYFFVMDAKKLKFKKNYFDIATSFDVFEHLYKDELELVMDEISRVLKPRGIFMVHTEPNKIYLDFTHRLWVYPINYILIKLNSLITKKEYIGLPLDPRNDTHKAQHVNEPTYFYLKNLFAKHEFEGKIIPVVPFKPRISWKDITYNIFVWFYPLSLLFPFHLLFAYDYVCIMKNKKI